MEPLALAQIRRDGARRWQPLLLTALADESLGPAAFDDVVATLAEVVDDRAIPELRRLLLDATVAARTRAAAGALLRDELLVTEAQATLLRWWHSGDGVLAEHALRLLALDAPDEVPLAVAGDAAQPLQAVALEAGEFCSSRAWEQARVAAAKHPCNAVRLAALRAFKWDEPIAATDALVAALDDADAEVAGAAAEVLSWYPSRHVLRMLAERAPRFSEAFDEVRESFLAVLHDAAEPAAPLLRRWAEPVADLLAMERATPKDEDGGACSPPPGGRVPVSSREVLTLLGDHDGPRYRQTNRLYSTDFAAVASSERAALREAFVAHPDAKVRWISVNAFCAWQDREALEHVAANERVGPLREWARIRLDALQPQPPQPAELARLAAVAADAEAPQSARADAVATLAEQGQRHAITTLAPQLAAPPRWGGWSVHVALLEALAHLEIRPPAMPWANDADHLHVQAALAAFS